MAWFAAFAPMVYHHPIRHLLPLPAQADIAGIFQPLFLSNPVSAFTTSVELKYLQATAIMASPGNADEWISSFMAEIVPDNNPKDVPSAAEIEAISDFLAGKIGPGGAVFLYTRDTVTEQTSGDIWYLIYHMAQHLPETQDISRACESY